MTKNLNDDSFFNYLTSESKDYWIEGDSYNLREEIKSWAGYFDWDKKRWRIDGVLPDDIIHGAFRALGLRLILIGPKE